MGPFGGDLTVQSPMKTISLHAPQDPDISFIAFTTNPHGLDESRLHHRRRRPLRLLHRLPSQTRQSHKLRSRHRGRPRCQRRSQHQGRGRHRCSWRLCLELELPDHAAARHEQPCSPCRRAAQPPSTRRMATLRRSSTRGTLPHTRTVPRSCTRRGGCCDSC